MREFLSILVILCVFKTGTCILCYECVSLNEAWCVEHFVGKDMSSYHDKLINCTGNCLKLVAHVDTGREFYVRTCDITYRIPNTCSTASQILGIPLSTVCVCDTDGCNGGHSSKSFFLLTFLAVTISSLYMAEIP